MLFEDSKSGSQHFQSNRLTPNFRTTVLPRRQEGSISCHGSTSEFCSLAEVFGELQVTACREHVVVEVQSCNDDTVGHVNWKHALARLPLQKALRLRDLLDQAIEAGRGIA